MTYIENVSDFRDKDKILVRCDKCDSEYRMLLISAKRCSKRNDGKHICLSCVAKASLKPQNNPKYWTEEKKKEHSLTMMKSENYRESLKTRKVLNGKSNPMYGKKHTIKTKQKMSQARKGKIGVNATGWKGGKMSLTRRVKGYTHREYKWYFRCLKRDKFKCAECSSKKEIDVHHIKPMAKLIKELLTKNNISGTIDDKYLWLIKQPEIIDSELKNGITLCRPCHRHKHQNWGSHEPR